MNFHDYEVIYGTGLDEVIFGDEHGNFKELTPEDAEALAAIAAESVSGHGGGPSVAAGLLAILRLFGR